MPRSSKYAFVLIISEFCISLNNFRKITEDAEYALYSVVLFNRVVDEFRTAARARKYE